MERIYFGTNDGKLVTNFDLANMVAVVDNKYIDSDDLDAIREYAKNCKGIKKEVKNPSIRVCLENGEKVKAIRLYYDRHPEVGLVGAKDAINKMEAKLHKKL